MNNENLDDNVKVISNNVDPIYENDEDKLIEEFIKREMKNIEWDINNPGITSELLKRKTILAGIFALLLFVFIAMIFFHFPTYSYVIGIIILFFFLNYYTKYDLIKYLKKEIMSRPNEKISNIIMNCKLSITKDNTSLRFIIINLISIFIALVIFYKPIILYEKMEGGYGVRFYISGITNFKTATIPATYKGKNIVSLRGNTFSNMRFLKEVTLPDTITEIRGQTFKNDVRLVSIKLPKNLREIKGSTFEGCTSLQSITIPDSVVRIGGRAFYKNKSLELVEIGPDSNLQTIGSSAFRKCDNLYEIRLPFDVYINESAFKESPTTIVYFNK